MEGEGKDHDVAFKKGSNARIIVDIVVGVKTGGYRVGGPDLCV